MNTIQHALEINNDKAILLSIKKEWLDKIMAGDKVMEVRKTMPWEISYPFVVFCYETKANDGAGRITAAFICNDIDKLDCLREFTDCIAGSKLPAMTAQFVKKSCLTFEQLLKYGNNVGALYGWKVAEPQAINMQLPDFGVKRAPQSWQYVTVSAWPTK